MPNAAIMINEMFVPFLAALLGAIIGGVFTLWGVRKAYDFDLLKQKIYDQNEVNNFEQMIRTEIETLWSSYQEGIGASLEALPNNTPFELIYPVSQNYFSVYDNNTVLLGKISDNDKRKLIVTIYVQAKGLLDSYRMNNESLYKLEQTIFFNQQNNNSFFRQLQNSQIEGLKLYADNLKASHNKLKQNIETFLNISRNL